MTDSQSITPVLPGNAVEGSFQIKMDRCCLRGSGKQTQKSQSKEMYYIDLNMINDEQ